MDSPTSPKCLECVKFYQHQPHATCRVCRDFGIEEKLLCDLNRMIQKPDPFHCHAFQPRLKLAGQAVAAQPTTPRPTPPRSQLQFVRDFLKSDKIKYQKAPDHVHIYVESDGEKSIEAIVKKLKSSSSKTILKQFPDIIGKPGKGAGLWDKAYFVETIG